jgi:hypothetical protein
VPRSIIAALLAVPAAVVLLSGCSAGQISQTDRMVPAVPGANVDSPKGLASLRNVQIRYNSPVGYHAGAAAPLIVYIVNNDVNRSLVLRGVTAAVAKGGPSLGTVALTGGAVDVGVNPTTSGSASAKPSASASAAASGSAASSASAKPSTSASASASASAALNLTIPPNSFARLAPDFGGYLAITSISTSLTPGTSAYLTFSFDGDEPTEIAAPFGVPLTPLPRLEPSSTPAE